MATATAEKSEVQAASIDSVFESIDSRADGHEEAYRQFVFDLVEGKAKLNGHTEINVTRTGRTLDTLRADVETCQRRAQALQQMEEVKKLQQKRDAKWKEFGKAFAEAEAFEKELKRKIEERQEEVSRIKGESDSLDLEARDIGELASQTLTETYDHSIDQQIQSHQDVIATLQLRLNAIDGQVQEHLVWVESKRREYRKRKIDGGEACTEEELDKVHPNEAPGGLTHQKRQLEQQIAELQGKVASLRAWKTDFRGMRWAPKN